MSMHMRNLFALIAMIFACGVAAPSARAEEPTIPENITFADVCSFHTNSGHLTCRDAGGNAMFKKVRVFKKFRFTPYPALPMFSAMKRLGFEGRMLGQIGDNTEIMFFRPVTCQ